MVVDIRQEFLQGKRSVCAVLGCGGGKSIIAANIAKSATDKGNRVLFIVHRRELCQQIANTFSIAGVDMVLCQIAMVQTVTRKLTTTHIPALIITDECHHALSNTYKRIYEYFHKARIIGFTATPQRMNEGGLGKVFDALLKSVSTEWLIKNNFLAPYKYFSVKLAEADSLNMKRGDYDSKELAELMESKVIYGETVKNYLKIARGKKTIVYCASIEASKKTSEEFIAVGIAAVHIDGKTPENIRNDLVRKFRENKIMVVCNVDLFGEGFDVPDCECVILLRPTKSLTLYIQQSMRAMRYKENKTAIIIDHVGNVYSHDLPDTLHEWTLSGKKQKKQNIIKVKECPVCYYCISLNKKNCPECGYVFVAKEVGTTKIIDIELEEIQRLNVLAMKPYSDYLKCKNFEELNRFQKAKQYKFSWVIHKARELNIAIPRKYQFLIEAGYIQ